MARSEGHWRESYCISHVSHPAVLSDHTLSVPGSVRWRSVRTAACIYLFSFWLILFGKAAPTELKKSIIYDVGATISGTGCYLVEI